MSLTPSKKISTVADIFCEVTKEKGITEIRLIDHDVTPKMEVGRCPKGLDGP